MSNQTIISADSVSYRSSTNVDPGCLQRIHAEYRDLDPDGTLIVDSPLVEQRGVMHRDLETAWTENDVIGFCLYLMNAGDSSLPQLQQLLEEHQVSKVGYVSMICVTQTWTRKQVGKTLLSRAMRAFESTGVELAAAEITSKPQKNIPSNRLFQKTGWGPSGSVQTYCFDGKAVEYEKWLLG